MNQRRFTVSHKTQKRMEHQNAKWPFMNVLGMFLVAKTLPRCGFLLISETDGACLHKASNMFLNMSKCYRFLVSVSSFSKPQLNFQKIETARILLSIRLWFFGGDFFLQAFFASFSNMNLNFGCSSCRKLAMWLTHLASRPQRPPMIAMACYGMLWGKKGGVSSTASEPYNAIDSALSPQECQHIRDSSESWTASKNQCGWRSMNYLSINSISSFFVFFWGAAKQTVRYSCCFPLRPSSLSKFLTCGSHESAPRAIPKTSLILRRLGQNWNMKKCHTQNPTSVSKWSKSVSKIDCWQLIEKLLGTVSQGGEGAGRNILISIANKHITPAFLKTSGC